MLRNQNLIQAHNHPNNTADHNVNSSLQHNLRLFETKLWYVGRIFFAQIPTSITEIQFF
jgi:hypothetical protein